MAGECATHDVDEVYDNDGNERNEAREALAGDRRAIAERIKLNSLTFLVKRKLQDHYVLLNRRQMLREWHTTRHMFHSEIGVRSVLRVVDEVLRTDELWRTRRRTHCEILIRLHVHSNPGREQNSAMYHIRGNAQWSGDQLHVRTEKWIRRLDEGNPASI